MKYFNYFLLVVFLVGCSVGPARIFQAKVPEPLVKTDELVELERRAADLIARYIKTPVELKPVAENLSRSLGVPEKPLPGDTEKQLTKSASTVNEDIVAALVGMQKEMLVLNRRLATHQGKDIEGTGFSMFGPGVTAIVIGLIALGVLFPPAFTLMAFAYRRLKAAAGIVVNSVEAASNDPETHAAVDKIKTKVREKMTEHKIDTTSLKSVVTNLKRKVA